MLSLAKALPACQALPPSPYSRVPNRLAQESSHYLRQHADQPVDWWPWGPEAFAEARRRDIPVLVSIGYASCHWCHVMARECFDEPWIADLMNRHFVCIKVDREERPEVDQFHMDAVQMIQQQGGWPLNSFCLPDGRPFFGGTYFPPDERGGRTPWPQVIMRIAESYRSQKAAIAANADAVTGNLLHFSRSPGAGVGPVDAATRLAAAQSLVADADTTYGGFGTAPKFPPPMALGFLFAVLERPDLTSDFRSRLETTLRRTLDAMDAGGLRDQVAGGFHRYCVDRDWTIPHFEKLLSDNALLLGIYARAAVVLNEPRYRETCESIITWLERDMRVGPAYATSMDADTGHDEGTTYTWIPSEVAALLGEESEAWCWAYGITAEGNFEGGRSVPTFRTGASRAALSQATQRLQVARAQRPQPHRDDKLLLGWNTLLAANLARAGILLNRPDWHHRSQDLLSYLLREAQTQAVDGTQILHGVIGSNAPATLQDYTALAEAILAVGACNAKQAGAEAAAIMARAEQRLGDTHAVGHFLAEDPEGLLPVRQKGWWDQAVPAGNSAVLALEAVFDGLGIDANAGERHRKLTEAYGAAARDVPHGIPRALEALERAAHGVTLVQVGPNLSLTETLTSLGPLDAEAWAYAGPLPGYQLCRGSVCLPSVPTLAALIQQCKTSPV